MIEFKPGWFYAVNWSDEDICCSNHSNDRDVVFIREYKTGWAEIAYSMGTQGICVGYVPYSALSKG
ncbi:MAG: hypothetical protein [Bacteriophage sp.]|nr:MAG: hypothetical protein [Bacteriophage sp.]